MSMPTCPSCIYAQCICEKTGVKIRYSTGCTYHKPKRMINADRIRSMTVEELARHYAKRIARCYGCEAVTEDDCFECQMEWLKSPVEEVDNG